MKLYIPALVLFLTAQFSTCMKNFTNSISSSPETFTHDRIENEKKPERIAKWFLTALYNQGHISRNALKDIINKKIDMPCLQQTTLLKKYLKGESTFCAQKKGEPGNISLTRDKFAEIAGSQISSRYMLFLQKKKLNNEEIFTIEDI